MKKAVAIIAILTSLIGCSKQKEELVKRPVKIYPKLISWNGDYYDTIIYDKIYLDRGETREASLNRTIPKNIDSLDNWHKKYYLTNTYKFVITYKFLDASNIKGDFNLVNVNYMPMADNMIRSNYFQTQTNFHYISWKSRNERPVVIVHPTYNVDLGSNGGGLASLPISTLSSPVRIKNNIISFITSVKILEYKTYELGADSECDPNPYKTLILEYSTKGTHRMCLTDNLGNRLTDDFDY